MFPESFSVFNKPNCPLAQETQLDNDSRDGRVPLPRVDAAGRAAALRGRRVRSVARGAVGRSAVSRRRLW